MKNRFKGLLCFFLILSFVLSGCSAKSKNPDNNTGNTQNQVTSTPVPTADLVTAAPTAEPTQVPAKGGYQYEQDLNIIDDNYRNYYEIFVYSYCDSNGDGVGDFNGIISKLDYISDMGFNGIWLMPIMPSPSYHKYDLTDYYNVDAKYGTLDDFKNLLTECHKRGIRLIIDYVFNHTSTQHPWFRQAVEYLSTLKEGEEPDLTVCPYVEYYNFSKEKKTSKYYKAGSSSWYYEAVFWDQMPDLALENPVVRTELENATKFWLDMGVDGFRLDAVKDYVTGDTGANVEVLKWFSDYAKSVNPNVYIVGECWDSAMVITSYYESGLTSFFNYPMALYNGSIISSIRKLGSSDASTFAQAVINYRDQYSAKNPTYIDAPFLSNHDNARISNGCVNDPNLMKMAAGVLLTMNGSPFVYYGDEIGMNSKGNKDENKRLPMNWSSVDTTGMTKGPAGADVVEQKFPPLDEQLTDPLSILNYYKRAVRIRNENPEIARGDVSTVDALITPDICAFKKVYNGSEIVIIYNMNKDAATVDLKAAGLDKLGIRGYLTVDGSEVALTDGVLNMPLYSIVILK